MYFLYYCLNTINNRHIKCIKYLHHIIPICVIFAINTDLKFYFVTYGIQKNFPVFYNVVYYYNFHGAIENYMFNDK